MDRVNHPIHYTQGGIECIDAIEAATVNLTGGLAVCIGNAIKYLWRFSMKNGVEDLDKAIWYIKRAKHIYQKKTAKEVKTVQVVTMQGNHWMCPICGYTGKKPVPTSCPDCAVKLCGIALTEAEDEPL